MRNFNLFKNCTSGGSFNQLTSVHRELEIKLGGKIPFNSDNLRNVDAFLTGKYLQNPTTGFGNMSTESQMADLLSRGDVIDTLNEEMTNCRDRFAMDLMGLQDNLKALVTDLQNLFNNGIVNQNNVSQKTLLALKTGVFFQTNELLKDDLATVSGIFEIVKPILSKSNTLACVVRDKVLTQTTNESAVEADMRKIFNVKGRGIDFKPKPLNGGLNGGAEVKEKPKNILRIGGHSQYNLEAPLVTHIEIQQQPQAQQVNVKGGTVVGWGDDPLMQQKLQPNDWGNQNQQQQQMQPNVWNNQQPNVNMNQNGYGGNQQPNVNMNQNNWGNQQPNVNMNQNGYGGGNQQPNVNMNQNNWGNQNQQKQQSNTHISPGGTRVTMLPISVFEGDKKQQQVQTPPNVSYGGGFTGNSHTTTYNGPQMGLEDWKQDIANRWGDIIPAEKFYSQTPEPNNYGDYGFEVSP